MRLAEPRDCDRGGLTESEFELLDVEEMVVIIVCRLRELQRAGCDNPDCVTLASRVDVSLGRALDLLARGCSAELALRILV